MLRSCLTKAPTSDQKKISKSPAVRIFGSRRLEDRVSWGAFGRELATIRLSDGREAGAVLVAEGLAKIYGTEGHKSFCLRSHGVQF